MQNYMLKKIGVAFPFYMLGRMNAPVPNKVDITIVVGEPLLLPAEPNPEPSEQLVSELHEQYYSQLRTLFEAHKAQAGFPDAELKYVV
jgi:2-acylglycerol O-acyltransferase 2